MNLIETKGALIIAFVGLVFLCSTAAVHATGWQRQDYGPDSYNGSYSKRRDCILQSHRVSVDDSWTAPGGPSVYLTKWCSYCKRPMVFSGGWIRHTFVWDEGPNHTPAPAWTLVYEETTTHHDLDDSPAGYGSSDLGPTNITEYKTGRYTWVDSSSGTIVRNYWVEGGVEFGPGVLNRAV